MDGTGVHHVSEISQSHNDKYHRFSLISGGWGKGKKGKGVLEGKGTRREIRKSNR
jgi:hypothetical protein